MMQILLVLLLLLDGVLSSDVILHPPRNTAVVANDVLRISCGTNSSHSRLRWYHTPSGSSKASAMNERETATLEKYREFGLIPGHNGSYDLYTGSVRISHSGIYTCKVTVNHKNDLADLLDATAHVIVLQSSPICERSPNMKNDYISEGDVIRMSCQVQFSGNWIPSMKWIQTPADPTKRGLIDYIGNSSITNINKDMVTSTLELTVNSSMNGFSFVCQTYFEGSAYFSVPDLETSDNVPEYNAAWTTGPLNISFGPRNIVFRPKREVFTIGDQVTCCADGNPGPVYEWKELETGFTTSGAVLTVEKTKPSYKAIYQFKCTARNNFSITDDVLIFTIEESEDFLRTWIVSGLLVIIGVLFVALVGGCLIYRRQNTRREITDQVLRKETHRLETAASTEDKTPTTGDTQTRMTDQSPDLFSTSSSTLADGSFHTYADIEDQIPGTPSPKHGSYNELMVDQRESTGISSMYRGLNVRDDHDQWDPFAERRDRGPWASTATPDGYGAMLSGNQEQVVQSSTPSD